MYPKVENNKLYLCSENNSYKIKSSFVDLLKNVPELNPKLIFTIRAYCKIVTKTKEYEILSKKIDYYINNKEENFFFFKGDTIYYGNPVYKYNKIGKKLLNKLINFPIMRIDGRSLKEKDIEGLIKIINNSKEQINKKILEELQDRTFPRYIKDNIIYGENISYIMDQNNKDFFFFKNNLFYGNIYESNILSSIDIAHIENYTTDKLLSLKNTMKKAPLQFNFLSVLLNKLPIILNKRLILSIEEVEILRNYLSINIKETKIYDEKFPYDVSFFMYIHVIDSHMTLYELYMLGFGLVENIKKTIRYLV